MISRGSAIVPVASWGLAWASLWSPCPAITARKPLPSSAALFCWEQLPEQEVGGMLENLSALVGALCRRRAGAGHGQCRHTAAQGVSRALDSDK